MIYLPKEKITFVSQRIYPGKGRPFAGYVSISHGIIDSMGTGLPRTVSGRIVDVGDNCIVPGFIDLHIHGCCGRDIAAADYDSLQVIAKFLADSGTTAFQPTLPAVSQALLERVISLVKRACQDPVFGARVLGLHLEGPFLNPAKKGAMREDLFLLPSLELMKRWVALSNGTIKQVTLAPELPGATEVIRYLAKNKIRVSAGHTEASYEQMQEALRFGVTVANHTFNAMRGFHHREPGALGALLTTKGVMCELIADGVHVHPAAMKLLLKAKGPEEVCLVTDAGPAAGMPPGRYTFMGQTITVDEKGKAKLPGGTIAGSTVTLNKCLKNMIGLVGIPFEVALEMATINPARVAGVAHRKGSLSVGKDADLVVLDDNYEILWSVVEGEVQKSPEQQGTG